MAIQPHRSHMLQRLNDQIRMLAASAADLWAVLWWLSFPFPLIPAQAGAPLGAVLIRPTMFGDRLLYKQPDRFSHHRVGAAIAPSARI